MASQRSCSGVTITPEAWETSGVNMASRDARAWARNWTEYLAILDKGLLRYIAGPDAKDEST